jgi:hypothetical protein
MFDYCEDDCWIIVYSDGDKRPKDAIKEDVIIMPATAGMRVLDYWENHECGGDDGNLF